VALAQNQEPRGGVLGKTKVKHLMNEEEGQPREGEV
jgi:hypothetical protein